MTHLDADDISRSIQVEDELKSISSPNSSALWQFAYKILSHEPIPFPPSSYNLPVSDFNSALDPYSIRTIVLEWNNIKCSEFVSELTSKNCLNPQYIIHLLNGDWTRFEILSNRNPITFITTYLTKQRFIDWIYITDNCKNQFCKSVALQLIKQIRIAYTDDYWFNIVWLYLFGP